MTTAGDATDQVSRARAQIQAFGTLATTIGTSLLTVSGYQSYVKESAALLTFLLLAAIVVLLVATVWLWTWYPGGPVTIQELKDQYPARAAKADAGLKAAFNTARDRYRAATEEHERLEERLKSGQGATQSELAWMGQDWPDLTERRLRELGELIRARRRAPATKITLAGIVVAEVVVAVYLFATVS
jgi:hypothetical protein